MSLSKRILLTFFVTLVLFIGAESAISVVLGQKRMEQYQTETLRDLNRLQEVYIHQRVAQVKLVLRSLLETQRVTVQDWAWWTGTIQAVQNPRAPEVATNFSVSSLDKADIDLIGLYDLQGNLVFGRQRATPDNTDYGPLIRL